MPANPLDFEPLVQSARELLDAVVSLDHSYQVLAGLDASSLQPEAARVREQHLQQLARMHAAISEGLKALFTSTAATRSEEPSGLDCCICSHVRGQHAEEDSGSSTHCLVPGCLCSAFTLAADDMASQA